MFKKKRDKELTEEQRKEIAKKMIEGYKKMAALNKELAEDGLISREADETDG
ncbi:hypothetical protein [Halothermothrix orenii]|uniref:Uncharacterized protein n=1 Tax=Halothermothrix orenii (strain H 168 / OCM 544 / DSM 9562) TaxID=373903 RepID=B8D0W5_HALOH|nr:hypothetical protein [Halothermothrix orenii]ACL68934.1 hypothetical protein Hore_01720 [Halothermothrix orenii H 168]